MRRLMLCAAAVLATAAAAGAEPFADRVVAHVVGTGGGAGESGLPGIVLGPPRGGGAFQGSTDTLSLGLGGTVTLAFDDNVIVDLPGPDLIVFENAFLPTGLTTLLPFAEPAIVEVSGDGVDWHALPCALTVGPYYAGCAGVYPVFANADDPGGPSPLVPSTTPIADLVGVPVDDFVAPAGAGGDAFDLAAAGLRAARFVRLTASVTSIPGLMGLSGFDLDALAAVHSVETTGAPDGDGDGYPDAADGCPAVFDPAQRDADGNGIGDACEATGGACAATVEGGKLTLTKLQTPAGDEGLAWSGTLAPLTGLAPDPLASGVRVVVADASAATLLDVTVPGGAFDKPTKTGWKVKRTTWTWQGALDGLDEGEARRQDARHAQAHGHREGRRRSRLRSALPLRPAWSSTATTGRCGETAFAPTTASRRPSKGKVTCK